ncbi:hypothetical protein DSM106972_074680 [Dulcicalothrix desertica PCC 7102]|uniref:Uncharacterized protein n=1 Tax=Dulcicalothrix desertica PCC 7102 TaxID=232991 RepID=A0A433V2M8_9CYAN|nr:hypothetical protein [Dulcicalothrix desertica]RUT00340.1 hypothetical protein DSM106972_074680 [Dulcicalothrix desertica PCC 7102]
MAVEPSSGEYFIDKHEITVINMCRKKHLESPFDLFQINETCVSGTI